MDAENEVFQGVPEVGANVVVDKCGLDTSSYQDLAESNGINNAGVVSSPRRDSMDKSYVFVADDPVDVVAVPRDLVPSSETLTDENHLSSEESTVVPNGDYLEPTVAEGGGTVEGSDIVVENHGSTMKEEVDVVLVDAKSLEINHDTENLGAEFVEIQTELAPSVLPVENQAPQVASTESLEQPIGALTTGSEADVLLEANTGTGGSVELKGTSDFIGNCGDRTEITEELVSGESIELPDKHDSRGVVLNMNDDSSQCKDLESVELDFDHSRDNTKETMQISSERSDEVPHGLESSGVGLVASAESGKSEDLVDLALGTNNPDNPGKATSGTNIETSDKLSMCQDSEVVISKVHAESGESKDLESIAPDTNNASKDNKETMDKTAELSVELSAGQDSPDMELEATSQSQDVSGYSDVKEAGDEYTEGAAKLDAYNKPNYVHMEQKEESELDISRESITLSLDVRETGDENQDCKDKQCETSDDPTEVLGAPNTIEADGYQFEETESEKLNLKDQNDFESFNDKDDEHECKLVVSDSPACQPEDVKITTLRSHVQLETEKAQPVEEGGTTQIHGVICQLDVDSKQESDSAGIQDNLINVRMQQTMNKENVLDHALCQNEFDLCAPQSNDILPQHDGPSEQTDGSVKILFGSLRTETEINSKPVEDNGSFGFGCEDSTTGHEVENQASTLSEATKFIDDIGVSPVDDPLRTETKNRSVENDECAPSDCQEVTIVHEIAHQAPRSSSAACTDDANEAGIEEEASGTIDNKDEAFDIQDNDEHAEDVILASKLKASSDFCNGDVHTNSDGMATVVLESSNKEGESDLLSGIAEVGDGLGDAVKNQEVNLLTQCIGAIDESQSSEVSADLTRSSTSAAAGQEFEEPMPRPFIFLVKVPRFDDEKLRDQIRNAQLEVDEKTRQRDAFRVQIQNKKPNLRSFGVAYDAAVSEEIDARNHLKATRNKIESLQSLIGRMKNAISVEDIDARIYNIEHRMQHETVSLKEEKQLIREIKQLKQHREYLSSNIGSQDEIQQALDQKDQNDHRLKALKKELVELKEKVSTAQAAAATAGKKYENENKIIQELQNQYRVANDVRQAAYENLLSLKKKLYEKNEHFRKYKNDASAASDYALSRNQIALNRLCVGQMENMMELWNNNEEFRKEYIRCNLRSTVRRLGTVDGRSLGPDEEPPVLPSYAIIRVDRSTSNPDKKSSSVETVAEKKIEPKIDIAAVADRKPVTEVTKSVKQAAKLEPERSRLANRLVSSSGADGSTSINRENLKAKEEHDLARKEDLRKEVETANLREQDRLEEIAKAKEALERKKLDEIAKAKEALERKKRLAEKAQIRAELRAQKEAEQREKEREKKLRKKERRRFGGAGEAAESSSRDDTELPSEARTETVAVPAEVARRPQKPSQFAKQSKSKPIPPPLRNRNRRKLQQWLWVIVTSALVIALFLLGNIGIFSKIRSHRSGF